jgi:hypothetical protein
MATKLRDLYVGLKTQSTAIQIQKCKEMIDSFTNNTATNLAGIFAEAFKENESIGNVTCPFIPPTRTKKASRNPVTSVMQQCSPLIVQVPSTLSDSNLPYEFNYVQREIPHLRELTKKEQKAKAWIDYAAYAKFRPVIGEVKWRDDSNSFYAFIQLLTYFSEMAVPNQIQRAIKHELFSKAIVNIDAFDLHILQVNFNPRSGKQCLVGLTYELAKLFNERLRDEHPAMSVRLGNVLCLFGEIDDGVNKFSSLKCVWMV